MTSPECGTCNGTGHIDDGEADRIRECPICTEAKVPTGGLWRNDPRTPGGKYPLVYRRDGSRPEWPYFVLGARDPVAVAALRHYAKVAHEQGLDPQYKLDVVKLADEFDAYRQKHGQSKPDAGPERSSDRTVMALAHGEVTLQELGALNFVAQDASYDPATPTLSVVYTNHRGKTASRKIHPLGVWFGSTQWHPEKQWILDAYDVGKEAVRSFAMKDMVLPLNAVPLQKTVSELNGQRTAAQDRVGELAKESERLRDVIEVLQSQIAKGATAPQNVLRKLEAIVEDEKKRLGLKP